MGRLEEEGIKPIQDPAQVRPPVRHVVVGQAVGSAKVKGRRKPQRIIPHNPRSHGRIGNEQSRRFPNSFFFPNASSEKGQRQDGKNQHLRPAAGHKSHTQGTREKKRQPPPFPVQPAQPQPDSGRREHVRRHQRHMVQIRPGRQVDKASKGERHPGRHQVKHVGNPGKPPFHSLPVQSEYGNGKARKAEPYREEIRKRPSRQRKARQIEQKLRHDSEIDVIFSFIIGIIRQIGNGIGQKVRGIIGIFQLHQLRLLSHPYMSVQNGGRELPVLLMMLPGRLHAGPVGKHKPQAKQHKQPQEARRNQILPAAFGVEPHAVNTAAFSGYDPESARAKQQKHPGNDEIKGTPHVRFHPPKRKTALPHRAFAPHCSAVRPVRLQDQTAALHKLHFNGQAAHPPVRVQIRIEGGGIPPRRLHHGKRIGIAVSLVNQADFDGHHLIFRYIQVKMQVVNPHIQPVYFHRQRLRPLFLLTAPGQLHPVRQVRFSEKKTPDGGIISNQYLKKENRRGKKEKPAKKPALPSAPISAAFLSAAFLNHPSHFPSPHLMYAVSSAGPQMTVHPIIASGLRFCQ